VLSTAILALDQSRVMQALDAPQAGGRRNVHPCRQVLVAERGVGLQHVQQGDVDGVE
jgi:hypothetical protein